MLTNLKRLSTMGFCSALILETGCTVPVEASDETPAQIQSDVVVASTLVGKGDPGAAVFQDNIFLTYIGTDSAINIMRQTGLTFTKQVLTERSNSGASLAVFNGRLFMSWVGTDGSVNVLSSADGIDWRNKRVFSGSKHGLPSMTVFAGQLQIIVNEFDNRAAFFASSDGLNWAWTGTLGDVRSNDGFASTVLNFELVLAWSGTGDRQVNVRKYNSSTGWGAISLLGVYGNPDLFTVTGDTSPPSAVVLAMKCGSGSPFGHICLQKDLSFVLRSTDGISYTSQATTAGVLTNDKPIVYRAFWRDLSTVGFGAAFVGTDHQLNVQVF